VAVLDEAMVAHGRDRSVSSGDPTEHAVMVAVREAARRLRRPSLNGLTIFTVIEPCAMCVGALLQCDADGLVYALPDPVDGACGSAMQLAQSPHLGRKLQVVSWILQSDALESVRAGASRATLARRAAIGT
jgi:tRNA(adenine34) deaminase